MANFTAADVKRLRDATGAGMMDCKKALDEADGDFDKAVEILRVKGAKDVGKRAERSHDQRPRRQHRTARWSSSTARPTSSPRTTTSSSSPSACSTSRSPSKPADVEALLAHRGRRPDRRRAHRGQSRPHRREDRARAGSPSSTAPIATYLHQRATDLPPPSASRWSTPVAPRTAARSLAMQIAAMRPRYLTRDEVPADVVENERASPRRPPARRASPSRRSPRSSRAGSTASSRTSCCSSSRRSPRPRRRSSSPRRGRCDRQAVRPLRGRPGLTEAARQRPRVPRPRERGRSSCEWRARIGRIRQTESSEG